MTGCRFKDVDMFRLPIKKKPPAGIDRLRPSIVHQSQSEDRAVAVPPAPFVLTLYGPK